jgi:hypothetical protein
MTLSELLCWDMTVLRCVLLSILLSFVLYLSSMACRMGGLSLRSLCAFSGRMGKTKDDTTGSCAKRDRQTWMDGWMEGSVSTYMITAGEVKRCS